MGWRVIPWHYVGGAKRPAIKGWPDRATTDEIQLREWWHYHPKWLAGLATGPETGLWVLDIDPRHGGHVTLRRLLEEHGLPAKAPPTFIVRTPSAGQHWYFRWPAGVEIRNSAGKLGAGLDVRGWHGFVAAPETQVEGRYRVIRSVRPMDAWPWLIGLVEKQPAKRGHLRVVRPPREVAMPTGAEPGSQERALFAFLCAREAAGDARESMIAAGVELIATFPLGRPGEPWTIDHVTEKVDHVLTKYRS
jgi:hypothetical protein